MMHYLELIRYVCVSSKFNFSFSKQFLQELEDYGIDIDGPVPIDNDNTVIVEDVDNKLSAGQKAILKQELRSMDNSSQEGLMTMYTVAKLFVHDCQQ